MPTPPTGKLTPRQLEYLTLIAEGLTRSKVAHRMGVTESAVIWYAREAFRCLGARSAAHAVHIAHQRGIFTAPQPEPRMLVPSGPTLDAMHRMLAAGWPLLWQAREAGINPGGVNELLLRAEVLSTTEKRVLAAAERLLRLDPVEYGINPRVVSRARNEARRRGWSAADAA